MQFHFHANQSHFLNNSFARRLTLKQRHKGIWKLPISFEPNPAAMWDTWKTLFIEIVDQHAPLKTKRISRKHSPWITYDLMHDLELNKKNSSKTWKLSNKLSSCKSCTRHNFTEIKTDNKTINSAPEIAEALITFSHLLDQI